MKDAVTVAEQNIHEAVASAESLQWLGAYLKGVLDGGFASADLTAVLEQAYVQLRECGNVGAADLVLDGLDLLSGWCGPGEQLAPPHAA